MYEPERSGMLQYGPITFPKLRSVVRLRALKARPGIVLRRDASVLFPALIY